MSLTFLGSEGTFVYGIERLNTKQVLLEIQSDFNTKKFEKILKYLDF